MAPETEVKTVKAPDQLTLALERTYLAHERNLMAWTRTATSLITFGFTLYKFFEYLHERGEAARGPELLGARTFGLLMIGIGVFMLLLTTLQHWIQMRRLRVHYLSAPFSLALVLAGLIASLGILGFITAILRQ